MNDAVLRKLCRLNKTVSNVAAQDKLLDALKVATVAVSFADQNTIQLESPAPISVAYRTALSNLAELYRRLGCLDEAASIYDQLLGFFRSQPDQDRNAYVRVASNLGLVHQTKARYVDAIRLYREAVDVDGADVREPGTRITLDNLAACYLELGQYNAAEEILQRLLTATRTMHGANDPKVGLVMFRLAQVKKEKGEVREAELLYRHVLEIRRESVGETHHDYGAALNEMALLYRATGRPAEAEKLFRCAVEIARITVGEQAPDYLGAVSNLAELLADSDRAGEAEALLDQIVAVDAQVLKEAHADFAVALRNRGRLRLKLGHFDGAESDFARATSILEHALGADHPRIATLLADRAELCLRRNDYDEAVVLSGRAADVVRTASGERSPGYAAILSLAALCNAAAGRYEEALPLFLEMAAVEEYILQQVISINSERTQLQYLTHIRGTLDVLLSFVTQYAAENTVAVQATFDLALRRKGLTVDVAATRRLPALQDRYPHLTSRLQELDELRSQIARSVLHGPGSDEMEVHLRNLADWQMKLEGLEASLASQIPEFEIHHRIGTATRASVARALPRRAVLVEYVRFHRCNFHVSNRRDVVHWQEAQYVAFVTTAGQRPKLQLINLGSAERIEELTERFLAPFRGRSTREITSSHMTELEANSTTGSELRKAILDPIVAAIGARRRVIVAPDGVLSLLPFEALPQNQRRVIDDFTISYLAVGRDIVVGRLSQSAAVTNPLVMANPDFDVSSDRVRSHTTEPNVVERAVRAFLQGNRRFLALPGTRAEGEYIARLLGVRTVTGKDAVVGVLKKHSSPRILHLATHGFFLQDAADVRSASPLPDDKDLGAIVQETAPIRMNPLLRSGLVFAGVNTWLQGFALPADAENGILTAQDAACLNLSSTDLVVLSACLTGVGDVHIGEGVFGLKRAFAIAGAKRLVVSLWPVPDNETKDLMVHFYDLILTGIPCVRALREAQLALKKRKPDPRFWAGFILQGDPGPLEIRPTSKLAVGPTA